MGSLTEIDERIKALSVERQQRKRDALRIYRPRSKKIERFHLSEASEKILRGGAGSGKSCAGFAELASAATGIPIIGMDGEELPFKYPKAPLLIWVIGFGWDHVGETIHRYLFTEMSGMKMIKDRVTGDFRIFRPWEPDDVARAGEMESVPQLIPHRLIDHTQWAWENKGAKQFKRCVLKNGTVIRAFSSTSVAAKRGDEPNIICIDEDIENPDHVEEWQSRLRKGGILLWLAQPYSHNHALMMLSKRAEQEKELEKPDIEEFQIRFSENQFIDHREKEKMLKRWSAHGEDVLAARDRGDYVVGHILMYPGFSKDLHGIVLKGDQGPNVSQPKVREISAILRANGGQPPPHWRKDLVLDPGHATTAVLFGCTPPDTEFDNRFYIVYDELYLHRHSADEAAAAIAAKARNQVFQSFVIAQRAARQTGWGRGAGETTHHIYSDAFQRHGLRSVETGSAFSFGADNVEAGCTRVRESMNIRQDGTTELMVVLDTTPNFYKEISDYKKSGGIKRQEVAEKPAPRQRDHLMDCLRYYISTEPEYIRPEKEHVAPSRAWKEFQDFKKARGDFDEDGAVMKLGPGAAE